MAKQIFALHLATQRFDFKVQITLARIAWAFNCSSVTCLYPNDRIKDKDLSMSCHVTWDRVASKLDYPVASAHLLQFIQMRERHCLLTSVLRDIPHVLSFLKPHCSQGWEVGGEFPLHSF